MKNIAAYTGTTAPYPAFISINETDDAEIASITLRSNGGVNLAWMEIPKDELIALANNILAKCLPIAIPVESVAPDSDKK